MPKPKKNNYDREKDRKRLFVLTLYPENELHQLAYLKLTSYQYNALGLLHDKDTYVEDVVDVDTDEIIHSEGDYKKEHYHFFVSFTNPRYISGLAKELGIESHLIDFCKSDLKSYAEYMLHWGKHSAPGKYIYDVDDFVGTLKCSAIDKLSNEPKELRIHKIFLFIEKQYKFIDYTEVYKWAFANGYGGVCTSRMNVINQWISDHNRKYYETNHTV